MKIEYNPLGIKYNMEIFEVIQCGRVMYYLLVGKDEEDLGTYSTLEDAERERSKFVKIVEESKV